MSSNNKKVNLVLEQIKLQSEIQNTGYNIVTCGHCGTVLLHRLDNDTNKIECFGCELEMDLSDCPDYWYEGAELSSEFNS
jgi:hypothetical protein